MQTVCALLVQDILKKFENSWSFDSRDLTKPSSDQVLGNLIGECNSLYQERLREEFFGFGPLKVLLEDESIQEIVVIGASEIWYESNTDFRRLEDCFLSEITFKNCIDRICAFARVKVDLAQPFADARWRDFRLHLSCAPLSHCPFHLTLRRFPHNPWTLDSLVKHEWCSATQADQLRHLIADRKNILFIGPTGCGKTTVLGACLKELRPNERVIIIEDTDELPRPNSASTKLLARPRSSASLPEIDLSNLVRQSLRMRPFRIVMGEVRGGEAKDLLLALATGHCGSLGTLHAFEARQALLRLEMLVQLGAPQWQVHTVRQLIHLSVDYLVVCGFEGGGRGRRRLLGISKIAALESFGFLLEAEA